MPAYLETTVHTSYKQLCQGAVLDYKLGNITEKSEMVGHCHMDSDRLAKQVVDLIPARLKHHSSWSEYYWTDVESKARTEDCSKAVLTNVMQSYGWIKYWVWTIWLVVTAHIYDLEKLQLLIVTVLLTH